MVSRKSTRKATRKAQKAGGFFDWLLGKKPAPVLPTMPTMSPANTVIPVAPTPTPTPVSMMNTPVVPNTVINVPNQMPTQGGYRKRKTAHHKKSHRKAHRKAHRKTPRRTHRKAHRKVNRKAHRKSRKTYRK